MFGKTGIGGQEYGKENYAGSIVSRSESYRCNGGRPAGSFQFAMVNPVITKKIGVFETEVYETIVTRDLVQKYALLCFRFEMLIRK